MRKILVTGALGQIGSELVLELRRLKGGENVIASDIRMPPGEARSDGPFEVLDATNARQAHDLVRRHDVGTIYHLAALLSATSEEKPHVAWELNMGGLYKMLEIARQERCALFFPSSIAAFGPSTPRTGTPQDTVQRPNTMYGVTKVAGELLADYYASRFGVDVRGLRFPGLISHSVPPGGGTTDYAVTIFYEALRHGHYTCFLGASTRLDMMYMPDAIRAVVELMEADPARLRHRNAFNIAAVNFTPTELAAEIVKHLPGFTIDYEIDPVRQRIADSWPESLDDSAARAEWGWAPRYDLPAMVAEMLEQLRIKLRIAAP
ncbi:MAG: L-threonine 3-dehydrogenase [Thermoanaerobaculia bacterium]